MEKIHPIGSEEFKSLDWKSQLEIIKLSLSDPDEYTLATQGMINDKQLLKLMEQMAFLLAESARKYPRVSSYPVTVVPHWIALNCKFEFGVYEDLLQLAGVEGMWFINTLVMKLPLLLISTGDRSSLRLADLLYRSGMNGKTGIQFLRVQTYLYKHNKTDLWKLTEFNQAVGEGLRAYQDRSLDALLTEYPVVEVNPQVKDFCCGNYVMYWGHRKQADHMISTPLIPRQFQERGFQLNSWSYLI
jgi:hypothetical protein